MDTTSKREELARLRARVSALEAELERQSADIVPWPPTGFYTTYHVLAGCVLGMVGAASSLLFNVVGALLVGEPPLHLIEVYLTFPLGQRALQVSDPLALAIGCCLYLGTGMILGVPFQLVLSRWFSRSPFASRLVVVSVMAVALWLINFYGILSWLQPLLFGGNWIVAETPWWVAALTHLVFGWTMLLVQPFGTFVAIADRRLQNAG